MNDMEREVIAVYRIPARQAITVIDITRTFKNPQGLGFQMKLWVLEFGVGVSA